MLGVFQHSRSIDSGCTQQKGCSWESVKEVEVAAERGHDRMRLMWRPMRLGSFNSGGRRLSMHSMKPGGSPLVCNMSKGCCEAKSLISDRSVGGIGSVTGLGFLRADS